MELLTLFIISAISTASGQFLPNSSFFQPAFTECGGVVPINTIYPTSIQYKKDVMYGNNEFCVWTLLHNTKNKIRLVGYQNFSGPYDGLVAYTWAESGLISRKLPGLDIDVTFEPSVSFLAFSSNTAATTGGFDILIQAYGIQGATEERAFHFHSNEGVFTYPESDSGQITYGDNERVSVVVQGQTNAATQTKQIVLRDLDIEPWDDSITVYTLLPHFGAQREVLIGKFSGNQNGVVRNSTTNFVYPNVYLFSSDHKTAGKGFTIQWKNFPHSS
ncbi:unnamed protein product [Allacma fusca]|uniref:CUB-like domain-containing protein n=1 Tax=Allacma fusca TaxID=39272 RepID=A0A8J2LA67_9HEXA|nr:unnamed protein product [Allacma fusca]